MDFFEAFLVKESLQIRIEMLILSKKLTFSGRNLLIMNAEVAHYYERMFPEMQNWMKKHNKKLP